MPGSPSGVGTVRVTSARAEAIANLGGIFDEAERGLQRTDQAIAMASMFLPEHIHSRAILATTTSGGTALYLSPFRSGVPIYGLNNSTTNIGGSQRAPSCSPSRSGR